MNDPFSVLGVSSSASEDEIKSAYRKLAKRYHPDVNPGDKTAEAKMREINEAYSEALRIKKGGGPSSSYGSQGYGSQGYGSSYGPWGSQGSYGGYNRSSYQGGQQGQQGGYGFDFDPFFSSFFGQEQQRTQTRTRAYANPELETTQQHILARRFNEAINLLNRITTHDADWHALYARADLGLGNRISALDHARKAVQMAPGDSDYENLLRTVESGRQTYQQSRQQGGYDFKSAICSNPLLTCCACNLVLSCCGGGRFIPFFCC